MTIKDTWNPADQFGAIDENAVAAQINQNTSDIAGLQQEVTAYLGDGSSSAFTVTHSLNTRDLSVVFRRTGIPWDEIIVEYEARTPSSILVNPGEVWALKQYRVSIKKAGQSDVTGPTTPTLAFGSATTTTLAVTASGSTDTDSGFLRYDFYLNGVFSGSSSGAYTYTGLTTATSYNLTCFGIDYANNPSTVSNTVTHSTN